MEAARPAVGRDGFGGGAVSHEVPSTPRCAHLCAVPGPTASSPLSGLGAALLSGNRPTDSGTASPTIDAEAGSAPQRRALNAHGPRRCVSEEGG